MSNASDWIEMDVSYRDNRDLTLGLIALSNDSTIQPDFTRFTLGSGVRVQTGRIPSPKNLDVRTLHELREKISASASNLMPDNKIEVIAFGCTSAAMALGSDCIESEVRREHPNIKVTDPVSAALKAFAKLGCQNIALLTPYIGEVNNLVFNHLQNSGINVVERGFFPVRDNDMRSYIGWDAFEKASLKLMAKGNADALFISCTALATSDKVERLEQVIGKPVITSNQALSWNALRLAGEHSALPDRGLLFCL